MTEEELEEKIEYLEKELEEKNELIEHQKDLIGDLTNAIADIQEITTKHY